jgi:hypothetical protein
MKTVALCKCNGKYFVNPIKLLGKIYDIKATLKAIATICFDSLLLVESLKSNFTNP